ncbi:MAG: hypothetical protein JWO05_3744 [Gemmatimonadetes bacterium]|nr:hypothetical protein [Gemmatimonadota bacterium]
MPESPPEPAYKTTFLDRHGPDGAHIMRLFFYSTAISAMSIPMWAVIADQRMRWDNDLWELAWVLDVVITTWAFATLGALELVDKAGKGFLAFLWPSGESTPYEESYSYEQSLVMQGNVPAALESFEGHIAADATSVPVRRKAAELYAGEGANPRRAAELFREIQRLPTVSAGDDIHASNRLADLYLGPLAEPGRALVELRRIIDRYPDSTQAGHARAHIMDLKRRLQGDDSASPLPAASSE